MDRLDAMQTLVAVVDGGSLSAAGRRLGVPLPTISRRISELEAHLGARLLVRSTRRIDLTDAGADYIAACRRILEEVGAAERSAAGEYRAPRGVLDITAPLAFGRLHLLPVITDFLAAHPEIDVRLALSDRNARLIDDHLDLGVRIGALPGSATVATRVGAVRRVVCASPAFLAAHGTPRRPAELAPLPAITFDIDAMPSWHFAGAGGEVALRQRLAVNTAEAAIDAAIAGVGVTRVLSYQVAKPLAEGALAIVLADFEPDPLPVHLIHAGQGQLPVKMRAFLDFAVPRLRAALAD